MDRPSISPKAPPPIFFGPLSMKAWRYLGQEALRTAVYKKYFPFEATTSGSQFEGKNKSSKNGV